MTPRHASRHWAPAPVAAALLMLLGTTLLFLHLRTAAPGPVPAAVVATIGYSVEGRPILCHQFGNGGPTILIKASIHGTEGAGTPLTQQLIAWLEAHPDTWKDCRILVMPVSNPDGWHIGKRFNAGGWI